MITKIDIPIYNTSVTILVEISTDELKNFYKHNKDNLTYEEYKILKKDLSKKNVRGSTMTCDSGDYVILLKNGKSDNFVSHEIFHVCNRILLDKGVNIDTEAEPWAYLIGWFTEEYYRRYFEYKDKEENKE